MGRGINKRVRFLLKQENVCVTETGNRNKRIFEELFSDLIWVIAFRLKKGNIITKKEINSLDFLYQEEYV